MRSVMFAFVSAAALAAVSAQAAPPPPKPSTIEVAAAPFLELVRDGCGRGIGLAGVTNGGYWRWGDCVPDGGAYGGYGAGSYYPPPFGATLLHHGAGLGVTHIKRHRDEPSIVDDPERAHPSGKLTLQHPQAGVIERVGSCRGR